MRTFVPEGLSESSPARTSCWEMKQKTSPSRKPRKLSGQGTIETLGFWSGTQLGDCQHSSIVPSGTDGSLRTLTQHFVLGFYEAQVVKPRRKKGLFECF